MKKAILSLSALAAVFSMSSCATILTGTKDKVSFNSNVAESEVKRNGVTLCYTPCVQTFKRSERPVISIEKDGFKPQFITMEKSFNGVAILNLTSLLGWGIDAATGAISRFDEKEHFVNLKPDGSKVIIYDTVKMVGSK